MKRGSLLKGRLASCLVILLLGCRSPLLDLRPPEGRAFSLAVPPVQVEDHSRRLDRLREVGAGDLNTPVARKEALEVHRAYLDEELRKRLLASGRSVDPASPYRLELILTTLGEVRTKYIVYGILSGVAWGVGTGLVTHNARLAVGLGAYELVEESLFWIAGSSLFGRYSAPVVLEARLVEAGKPRPVWEETYYVIWGGQRLKERPEIQRARRSVQLQASLDRALDELFGDLAALPAGAAPAAQVVPEVSAGSAAPAPSSGR